jgi:hypothetical protein
MKEYRLLMALLNISAGHTVMSIYLRIRTLVSLRYNINLHTFCYFIADSVKGNTRAHDAIKANVTIL